MRQQANLSLPVLAAIPPSSVQAQTRTNQHWNASGYRPGSLYPGRSQPPTRRTHKAKPAISWSTPVWG